MGNPLCAVATNKLFEPLRPFFHRASTSRLHRKATRCVGDHQVFVNAHDAAETPRSVRKRRGAS